MMTAKQRLAKNVISNLRARLVKGSRKSGLRLTAQECAAYADAFPTRGRPADNVWEKFVTRQIGADCVKYEQEGMRVKDAIKAIIDEHRTEGRRVSASTVRDQRRFFRVPRHK